jgi:hypothetical protein
LNVALMLALSATLVAPSAGEVESTVGTVVPSPEDAPPLLELAVPDAPLVPLPLEELAPLLELAVPPSLSVLLELPQAVTAARASKTR